MALGAQKARAEDETSSLKHLAQTGYLQGKSGMTMDPGRFSPYAQGMMPKISDAQRQGAATLEPQLLKRLAPGGTISPEDITKYARPGTLENIAGYGGAAASVLGGINKMMKGGIPYGKIASKIGGIFGGNKGPDYNTYGDQWWYDDNGNIVNAANDIANNVGDAASDWGDWSGDI